jgi:hypothetical protein
MATLQKPRDVHVNFFKFRQDSTDAGVYGSQGRDDYSVDDVEHYFNYMGMLAVEGTYDRMELMLSSGKFQASSTQHGDFKPQLVYHVLQCSEVHSCTPACCYQQSSISCVL